jgi:bifunctional enzyme CysN/CysC
VLVDARKGIVEQTRRHAFLASLLRVPHLLLCVNKMDLVGYDRNVFESIREEFAAFASRLEVVRSQLHPHLGPSGRQRRAAVRFNMPWYEGASLLHHLEQVYISSDRNLIDPRLPVQWVIRPQATSQPDYRGYAGRVAGGVFRPGDEVMVLPSGLTTTVAGIDTFDGPLAEAFPPMSVTVRLADDVDISRGDLICRPMNQPTVGQDLEAMVAWMTERPLKPGDFLALKHTTRWVRAVVRDIHYRLDVNTLHRDESATSLASTKWVGVSLRVTQPLYYDSYRRNRQTGSFILAAEDTNVTWAPACSSAPTEAPWAIRPRRTSPGIPDTCPASSASTHSGTEGGRCGSPVSPVRASRQWRPRSNSTWWPGAGVPTGWTATTSAPDSTPTSDSAVTTERRTLGGHRRWHACSLMPVWWPWWR